MVSFNITLLEKNNDSVPPLYYSVHKRPTVFFILYCRRCPPFPWTEKYAEHDHFVRLNYEEKNNPGSL